MNINRKGTTQGYCTWCEKDVPVNNPKHNQKGVCSCCNHKIQYKSVRKMKSIVTEEDIAYLVQRCGNGLVVREFTIKLIVKMSSYRKPMFLRCERRRFVYDNEFNDTEYYYGYDKIMGKERWKQGRLTTVWGSGWCAYVACVRGKVYKKNLLRLNKTQLGKTGFPEYAKRIESVSPIEYFDCLLVQPMLEKLCKAGLIRLAEELLNGEKNLVFKPAKGLGKALSIDQFRLKRLRENDGGMTYLNWLRFEKEQDTVIPDSVIKWMQNAGIVPENLTFIRDYMSAVQVKNYLVKQSEESGENVKALLTIWEDYLIMAKRMNIDIDDPIVYRARYLVKRHNELVQVLGNKDIVLKAEEIEAKFPALPDICSSLKKYEYSNKEYKIIAPRRIEDIILDGRKLQHCIYKNDRYFERMNDRESYILFLRKADEPAKPYYTLEVEPSGTVRQKRTLYNRQLEDIKEAEKFLMKWQKQLQRKLMREDFELAKASRELRIKEMEELRKNEVRLYGNFNGRLLADVLTEDLMEIL